MIEKTLHTDTYVCDGGEDKQSLQQWWQRAAEGVQELLGILRYLIHDQDLKEHVYIPK